MHVFAQIRTENKITEARTRLVGLKIKGFEENEKTKKNRVNGIKQNPRECLLSLDFVFISNLLNQKQNNQGK